MEWFQSRESSTDLLRAKRSETVANLVGYSILGAGIVANSAFSAGVLSAISPQLEFMPLFAGSFLGQMSFVSVSLLAPFLEPVSSQIRRKTFELTTGRRPKRDKHPTLEEQADRVHATYTLREQHATDRVISFRNAIRLNLQAAVRAWEARDEDGVVAEIADAAILGFRHFRDISPQEETILYTVRATLTRRLENPEWWGAKALQAIESLEGFQSEASKAYYEQLLGSWFQPR